MPDNAFILWSAGAAFSIISGLLANKNASQQKAIDTLWEKHDQDAAALETLKLQVAGEHYKRNELDIKFDRLESTLRTELHSLGAKFDKLGDAILAHIIKEDLK